MVRIEDIDLNLLRVFQAVLEEQSLTRAGERLTLSQPAISYSLGRLRAIFDDPLFIRARAGMKPSARALALSPIINRALEAVREALRYTEGFDPLRTTRKFRILVSDAGEMNYIPLIWNRLRLGAPNASLRVEPMAVEQVGEALRSNRLDCAIGNLPSLMDVTVHELLFREDYVCMTRRRTGLPQSRNLSVAQFSSASHVRVESIEHSHLDMEEALRAKGIGRNVVLELAHFVSLPGLLATSDLFVTLPRRLAQSFNRDGIFQIYGMPVRLEEALITLHWHEFYEEDAGNKWFRTLVAEVAKEFGPAQFCMTRSTQA